MRYWCRLVGFWLLMDAVLLAVTPGRVAAFVAFEHYLGIAGGTTMRYIVLGVFGVTALACFIAAQFGRVSIALALSVAFTATLVWTAIGVLVAFDGFGDFGRLTLYLIWLYTQAERLRFLWVSPTDEQEVRDLLARLKRERRRLERRQEQEAP